MKHLTLQQLSASLDEVLVGVSQQIVRRHLSVCEECRARHASLGARDRLLARLLSRFPDPAWLEDQAIAIGALIEADAGAMPGSPRPTQHGQVVVRGKTADPGPRQAPGPQGKSETPAPASPSGSPRPVSPDSGRAPAAPSSPRPVAPQAGPLPPKPAPASRPVASPAPQASSAPAPASPCTRLWPPPRRAGGQHREVVMCPSSP